MIQQDKVTGKYRARWDYGHTSYYKKLLSQRTSLNKEVKALKKKAIPAGLDNALNRTEGEILRLEERYGKPVRLTTRRSFITRHLWQAKQAEELFQAAHDLESEGRAIPRLLHAQINSLTEAPRREDFLEELAFQFASIAGFHETVLSNSDYEMFLAQSDANTEWIIELKIGEKEVRAKAHSICSNQQNLVLKNKNFIFTGSFISYTVCEDYIKCLEKLALKEKVDGIITAGPWIKYIFLHKTAGSQKILDCVRSLTSKVPVYAIRANQEDADLIPVLKDLGIRFLNRIEDEKNVFLNHQFGRSSNKDQLAQFRDYHVDKNMFVHSTYVAMEHRLVNDNIRMILGSGSSSYHTPSARIWANSYDSQHLKSEKYDEIGGHFLRFDGESECYPQTFYYNAEAKGVIYSGSMYTATTVVKGKINILVSDGHFSGVHTKGYQALKQFIVNNYDSIEGLILNGDIFDNEVLCHWNDNNFAKQIKIKNHKISFLHEVVETRLMIKELVALATNGGKRKIRLVYKMGNHENSSFKKLEGKSITHFLSNMLDLDPLLELSSMGFEIIAGDKPFKVGDVNIIHGHEMHRQQAYKNFGRKSTIGHSHRGSTDCMGVILPTLEDQEKVDYFTYYKRAWAVGWGIITNCNGVTEKPSNLLIKGNKFLDLDGVKKIEKCTPIVMPKQLSVSYNL